MSVDEVIEELHDNDEVQECYVLVRELNIHLDVGDPLFGPPIRVKIWKSDVISQYPYHFTVSHYVHTPTQAAPYMTSMSQAQSESEAIRDAISRTTSFIKSAITQGHKPSDEWMIPNDDF